MKLTEVDLGLIKDATERVQRYMGEEIERRVREWIEQAQGKDFAAELVRAIKERDALSEEVEKLKINWNRWNFEEAEERCERLQSLLEKSQSLIVRLADTVPEKNSEYWPLQSAACNLLKQYREEFPE